MAFFFPEWIPWWLQLVIVGIVVIFGICFLLMPFSVLGLKSRLTYLDHQMEDIQAQLRVLLKRIPDPRERLEFKLQPVSTAENDPVREGNTIKEKKSVNSAEYYSAASSVKNRATCFDPPVQPNVPPVNASVKTATYQDDSQILSENWSRDRVSTPIREQRMAHSENRDEQLYDPPPVREERQEDRTPRRRAEPILRWPPK